MEPPHKRRKIEHEDKIRQSLRDKKLVVIVGAGISLCATHPSPQRITWTGLIRNGLDYLEEEGFVAAHDRHLKFYRESLEQDNADVQEVLRVCSYVKDKLDQNKQYPTWLQSVFGSLHCDVTHPEVFKPLQQFHRKGARLMTTNYDELLEYYCNLQRVRRSIPDDVRKYEQGTLNGVFHIHGSFQDPKEVVLDPVDYYQVKTSDDVQNLLKTYLGHKTILFIGCGSGLNDPNFTELLKWASNRAENIPNDHYLLTRDGDSLRYNPLITLRYGPNYENLVPYLNALLKDQVDASVDSALDRKETSPDRASGDLLQLLPNASQAPFNVSGKDDDPLCLHNTRVELLQQIREWVHGDDERHIFWLSGWAGTGKSTIARTVAREHYDRKHLIASFFFSRDGGDVGHAGKFFTSIAVQLAHNVPHLRRYVCEAIKEQSDIASLSLRDQWHHLILVPLSKLSVHSGRSLSYILVVDALDECNDKNHIRIILELLAEARSLEPVRLRIFITSRPESPIRHGFYQIPDSQHQDLILHSVSSTAVERDITNYLEHNLEIIRQECQLPDDWPGEQDLRSLVQHANGLFIWAATASRFIREGRRFATDRLSVVLDGDCSLDDSSMDDSTEGSSTDSSTIAPEEQLNRIYLAVLQNCVRKFKRQEKKKWYHMLRETAGAIIILFSPLSAFSLAALLDVRCEDITRTLDDLHSILDIPDDPTRPIRLHPSFRDFLISKKRCNDAHFQVDEKHAHRTLVTSCIRLMSVSLKQDICGVCAPGMLATHIRNGLVEQCLPPEVQYACLHWVPHLQKSGVQLCDNDEVHQFLQVHLLHWLEALSWMRKISEGIHAITFLGSITLADDCSNLYAFLHDVKPFVLYSRAAIEQAPLQVYCSALVFAPAESIVTNQFEAQIPQWVKRLPNEQNNWIASRHRFEGHSAFVNVMAFSPDGKRLASASQDKTIKLWETATGAALQTIEGHSNWINVVAFSPNNNQLASGSWDETIRLWDAATGAALLTLRGHSNSVGAVAFSPDGKRLASGSRDETVKLWNMAIGTALYTLEAHSDWVTAVAFSLDGSRLASASDDKTVRLWDTTTGAALQTFEGHLGSVYAIDFSSDGHQLASASYDTTIRLWDTDSGAALQTFEGHSRSVTTVAFSPDGKQLASASYDRTVRLWDREKEAALRTIEVDAVVQALTFSHNGSCLETDRGVLDLSFSPGVLPSRPTHSHGIFVKDDWIARGAENLLWLPRDYRPSSTAVRGSVVVLGHATGRVSFLEFALEPP